MVRLIEGGLGSVLTDEMHDQIRRLIEAGEETYLIVPEQQTLIAEKECAYLYPPTAPLCFEATNFTRLANTVFRKAGGLSLCSRDGAEDVLLMWQTLSELAPVLTERRSEISEGSVNRALLAVREIERLSASEENLLEIADTHLAKTKGRLKTKLSELSLIMSTYHRLKEEKKGTYLDDLSRMCDALSENEEIFHGAHFFLDGFTSFTEVQYRAISILARRAEVTVLLTLPKSDPLAFEYLETRQAKDKLLRLAAKHGIERRSVKLSGSPYMKNTAILPLAAALFHEGRELTLEEICSLSDTVRVFAAHTPYEEASFIASDILRRVHEGGRFSDFAVIGRNMDRYLGILDTVLSEANIPHFLSAGRGISSFEPIKLIEVAYATIGGGFRTSDFLCYAKCALSGITADEADKLEIYIEKWQLTGRRLTDEKPFSMNPDGYTDRRAPDTDEYLAELHEVRMRLIAPLVALERRAKRRQSVKEHATALIDYLIALEVEEKLARRAEELFREGQIETGEQTGRLYGIILATLERLVDMMGEFTLDASGFLSLLKILFSSVNITSLPARIDEVILGNADTLRLPPKKHIYLVGVNEGEFPAAVKEGAYFSESERVLLSSLGLGIEPENEKKHARELFCFLRALTAGRESVTLLYTQRDASYKASSPAEPIGRIRELTHGKITPISISDIPPEEWLYTKRSAFSALGGGKRRELTDALGDALLRTGDEDILAVLRHPLLNSNLSLGEQSRERLYGKELSLTQSRIDTYAACPLRHFLTYALRLGEGERAQFGALNIGSMVHAVLEDFFREGAKADTPVESLTPEERRERVEKYAKKYVERVGADEAFPSAKRDRMLARIVRATEVVVESLCEEFQNSRFRPEFFELKIEKNRENAPAPVVIGDEGDIKISVYGTIDRVDVYREGDDAYLRVVDYKTGGKDFSPSDLNEGKNLQMFLYLRSITESESFRRTLGLSAGGRVKPAGVIYVNTGLDAKPLPTPREDAVAVMKNQQKRKGMLLYDPVSIGAMNPDFLPIGFTKDGSPTASSASRLYTEEGWGELCEVVDESVRRVGRHMRSGDICASPIFEGHSTHCEYCPYKPVCRNANL